MKNAFLAMAAAALIASPAAAVQFTVNVASPVDAVPSNNDFRSQLSAAGLDFYTALGAGVGLTGPARLTFAFMGSESGFSDSFSARGGAVSVSENTSFTSWAARPIGRLTYGGGAITDWLFDSSGGAQDAGIGTREFGIFVPRAFQNGGNWLTNVLYLGFDDQISNIDDNHDDMIIRITATAVPEPASWAMMILGFGMVGTMLKRRRGAPVAA